MGSLQQRLALPEVAPKSEAPVDASAAKPAKKPSKEASVPVAVTPTEASFASKRKFLGWLRR
jgi:hypothetical protein